MAGSTGRGTVDARLLARAGRDDGIAFSELVLRTYPRALRVATLLGGGRHAPEHLVEEAIARLQPQLAQLQSLQAFAVGLFRLLAHLAGRRGPLRPTVLPVRPEAQTLAAWLAPLPERPRIALALRLGAELGYQEIAAVLQITPAAVGAALATARSHVAARAAESVVGGAGGGAREAGQGPR